MFTHLIIFSVFNFVRGNQLEGDHIGEGDGTNKFTIYGHNLLYLYYNLCIFVVSMFNWV